jgi:hypothetical protein
VNGGLGEAAGLLIALPFIAVADYFKFIKELPPGGQQELAKACHGIGMLALLAYWFQRAGGFVDFVTMLVLHPDNPLYWIPVGIAACGLGWFLLNARFAAQSVVRPYRATMIVRGLIKSAIGYAVWAFASDAEARWVALLLSVVAVWCMATGAAKVLLMIWSGGRGGDAYPMVEDDIASKEFDWNR